MDFIAFVMMGCFYLTASHSQSYRTLFFLWTAVLCPWEIITFSAEINLFSLVPAKPISIRNRTKFHLEFPRGPFSPVDFQGLVLAQPGFRKVQQHPASRHPIKVKRGKSERQQVRLQLAFTLGQRECEWIKGWEVESGSDYSAPPKETLDMFLLRVGNPHYFLFNS